MVEGNAKNSTRLSCEGFHGQRQMRVERFRGMFRQRTQGHQSSLFFIKDRRTDVRE